MDGLPASFTMPTTTQRQHTIGAAIGCTGTGLHTGRRVELTLHPAPAGHGIVFRRTDLGIDIPARHDFVADTRLCTLLAHPDHPQARVGTIEHLMAALAGLGIDNLLAEVDGPELPILDGSAQEYVFLLDCAGTAAQDATRPAIEVLKPVRVEEGEAWAELRPAAPGATGFDLSLSIAFSAVAIGRQALSLRLSPAAFRHELAAARTFTLAEEVEAMRRAGLALGGGLHNAVVVDGAVVLNPAGLRTPDEFVRHKLLDAVGDLALAGAPIIGRFVGHRSGHRLNNLLLRALLAAPDAFRFTEPAALSAWAGMNLPAAAAPA
jgi:UDP-3-O-[3-hydroxymyristoyl] N-acetylglucosamine deacetylase